ncbi:MraY family glycosyltransferase [Pseudomonas donghuensis]|uniref:MraY family glycosyltransferase n=1 Tax=Pseudomonas donghuensis TaxID=1163398 RepID=UPI00029AF0A9|nr:glycosyltransferase family 4 protein [Pseudomonas donghuensis]
MISAFVVIFCFIGSFSLTAAVRRFAILKSVMDIPNARSSHSVPTPRGGGVAIVVCFLLALPCLYGIQAISGETLLALLGAGAGVALLGFFDDLGHIAARWRLIGHFFAAIWIVFLIGGLAPLEAFGFSLSLGWVGHVLAVLYLVWMLNLYNFMDGIDGLASSQAIFVTVAAALIWLIGGYTGMALLSLALAASAAGFLCWNFPPAKIFMGDAGSGFLGIVLGGMSLLAAWTAPNFFWSWLILLGVFIVDATFTLLRRLLRKEKLYEAHRSHAYQFASRYYSSHRTVTLTVWLVNIIWLFPLALCVAFDVIDGALGTLIAYVPLVWLAIKFKAGALER